MNTAQVAKQLGTNVTSLSKWARNGCPAPPRVRNAGRVTRIWTLADVERVREWLARQKQKKQPQGLTTAQVARIFGLRCVATLGRWAQSGCPAPPLRKYGRRWTACDIGRVRMWLAKRAKQNSNGYRGCDASGGAAAEARALYSQLGTGDQTVASVLADISIAPRQVGVLRKIAPGFGFQAARFREAVKQEFLKLVQRSR